MIEKIIKCVKKAGFVDSVIETDEIFFAIGKRFPNVTLRTACAAVEKLREELYK